MSRSNYLFYCILAIIAAVLLNGAAVNYLYGSDEYIRATDIVGNEYLEKRSTLRFAERRLSEYDQADYGKGISEIMSEIAELEEYRAALKYRSGGVRQLYSFLERYSIDDSPDEWADEKLSEYDLTDEQAAAKIEQLKYCLRRLNYAAAYHDYIEYIASHSSSLLTMQILRQNSYAAQNAAKAKRDFYGLEDVNPTAESDIGVICLFSDHATDILCLACAAVIALLSAGYRKKRAFTGGGIFSGCMAACIGAALIYASEGTLIDRSIGLGELSRPVQSVTTFLTCSSLMSVGELAALRIFFKLMLCAAVYFTAAGLILSPKKRTATLTAAVIVIVEAALYKAGGAFRAASVFGALSPEEFFAVYGNINLFGNAVAPKTLFVPAVIAAVAGSALFASKSAAAFGLAARESAERAYYDKISSTYDETRKIRHDISNHLSALTVLLDNENVAEARRYLAEISSEIAAGRLPVNTGRAVLDALLYSKTVAAEKESIVLTMEFTAVIGEKYTDFDLCGIFGNILDNAIEGCRKAKGDRVIRLTVKRQMDMLCIFCENSSAPLSDPDMATDKPDKSAHGFGLKRIRQLAEKYGGGVEISAENEVFTISVII